MCTASFVVAVNTTGISIAGPAMANDLALSTSTLGWVINAYMLTAAALVVLGGQIGDVIGRKRIVAIGLGAFVVGTVLIVVSFSGTPLILGRVLQGIGAAVLVPAVPAVVSDAFPQEERSGALGIWGTIFALGLAIGPLYGGFFTDLLSWRLLFLSTVVLMLVAAAMLAVLRGLPERQPGLRPDVLGSILFAIGTFLVVLALQQGPGWGWTSGLFVVVLVVGVLFLAAFGTFERTRRSPMVHFALFRNTRYVAGTVTNCAAFFTKNGFIYFFSLYAQSAVLFDFSPLWAGVALLPYSLTMFATTYPSGWLGGRIGQRTPIVAGFLLAAVGSVMFARINVSTTEADLWLPLILVGVGMGLTSSTTIAAGMSAVPPERAGEGSGVINMAAFLGVVLAVAIGTILYVGQGVSTLNDSLNRAGTSQVEEVKLDRAMSGSPGALTSAADGLDREEREAFITGARQGTIDGFGATMWLMAAVSLGGALVGFWLLRPTPERSPPRRSVR
ncbi:MAG: MFS transporter [Rubrobacteraceae bacterium]